MTALASLLAAIDRTRGEHVAALNANDADAWVRRFAPDGVQMPPNDADASRSPAASREWRRSRPNIYPTFGYPSRPGVT
jgi:ketosteroid isomerase-like protein